jgi:group I intron endonuclease
MNILEKHTQFKKGDLSKKSGVYIITNTNNNKIYIGETTNLENRFIEHLRRLLSNRHANEHLQNAVNLYSIQSFRFDVLEFCEAKDTKKREHYWVVNLHALDKNKGYNIKPTDPNKINLRSKETSRKIYETKKRKAEERGYWHSKESIERRKITRKGYKHSEETKEKIGIKSLNRKLPNKSIEFKNFMSKLNKEKHLGGRNKRKIIQFTKDDCYIKTWNSITEAAKELNVSIGSIGNCLTENSKQKTCKGYKWKYETM